MLKVMRKNTKLVIWIVIVAFCLWGGYAVSLEFQREDRIAGEIFGKKISLQEFGLFYRTNQIFSFAGKKPADDPNFLKTQTWQSLIYSYEARNQKIDVSDEEVRQEVMRLLKDQKIESPSADFYKRWLQSSFGFKPNEFEGQLREMLRIQKMVSKFNEAGIEPPTQEQIQERFKREQNSLDLEVVAIPKPEDAKAFYDSVQSKPSNWDKEIKTRSLKVQATNKITLDAILNLWQIPQETALDLLKQDKGFITPPFTHFNGQAVTRLKDKEIADDSKLTEELKKQIIERLTNQKKYQRFIEWNTGLEKRADLKDYTPQPPAATPAPEQTSDTPAEKKGASSPSPSETKVQVVSSEAAPSQGKM